MQWMVDKKSETITSGLALKNVLLVSYFCLLLG